MTTPAKSTANRKNALRSTGPRTPEGKAVAARNALRHGLLSREVLVPNESQEDLEAFGARLRAELCPVGELEALLVDRIVSSAWRLRRVLAVEAGLFSPPPPIRSAMDLDFRKLIGAPEEDEETRELTVGEHFHNDAHKTDAFSKLSRYEAGIERALFRALHELQRLQAARGGEFVPPPVAVDVALHGAAEAGV